LVLLRGREGGLLFRRCLFLMLRLPFVRRHAIDLGARLVLAQRDPALGRGLAIPVAQAIAAEAGGDHHVDVLHIRALPQMRDQPAESRRFQRFSGLVVHILSLASVFTGPF